MARYQALGSDEKKSARAAVKAARALPRIEHKSARSTVIEAKSRHIAHLEALAMSPKPLPESQEQFRDRLAHTVRDLLDQDGSTWTCIEGTYPDRVIVSVHGEEDGRRSMHYSIPYTVTAKGDITLDKPQPVELATIVVPEGTAHRAATEDEAIDARVVQPTVGALADATARVSSSTAGPEQLEDVRDKVRELIAALSAKGLDVDEDAPPAGGRPSGGTPLGLDLWDEESFSDDDVDEDDEDDEEAPDDAEPGPGTDNTVRLDADEVKAVLALMRS
ncbi:hypothetical protein R2F25_38355 [Streptomyces sp. UP1A-1]|nr:hypothetical protein [Streptomyces sp. UP1A-1]